MSTSVLLFQRRIRIAYFVIAHNHGKCYVKCQVAKIAWLLSDDQLNISVCLNCFNVLVASRQTGRSYNVWKYSMHKNHNANRGETAGSRKIEAEKQWAEGLSQITQNHCNR